jgi:hypothetical protein
MFAGWVFGGSRKSIVGQCGWPAASESERFASACAGWQEARQVIDLLACRRAKLVD